AVLLSHVFGLALMGAWPGTTATSTAPSPPTRPKEWPTVKPEPPPGTIDWKMDGEVAVYLVSAERNRPGEPGVPHLKLKLIVHNLSTSRELRFQSWLPKKDTKPHPDDVVLTTRNGKQYAPVWPPFGQPAPEKEGTSIAPTGRLAQELYFDAPADGDEATRWQLPLSHSPDKKGLMQLTVRESKK